MTPSPFEKAELARSLGSTGAARAFDGLELPDRPARPARPPLVPPGQVKRRKIGSHPAGRIALLHALAHIELNAIDLACDLLARFASEDFPETFFADWCRVAREEGYHFSLLAERLKALGAAYGDLPAHDSLWQAAEVTADDLLARLAIVPLVLEARGLDVTPAMIAKLEAAGDGESAQVLKIIYRDEIGHVAIGRRWFDWLARARGVEPKGAWQDLVRQRFKGGLKPPFNAAARSEAGLPSDYYEGLA